MKLQHFLKRERARTGLSQDKLSVASGVPVSTIRGLERGLTQACNVETFRKFWAAMAFDANEAFAVLTEMEKSDVASDKPQL